MPLKKSVSKIIQSEKHSRTNSASTKVSKGSTGSNSTMKMTVSSSTPTMPGRLHHRKVLRLAGKRPGAHHHHHHHAHKNAAAISRATAFDQTACDNSDDSGLGFDHHMDMRSLHYIDRNVWIDDAPEIKRRKLELKVENEETNDGYCFPETLKNCKENNTIIRTLPCTPIQNMGRSVNQNVNSSKNISRCLPLANRRQPSAGPVTLTSQLSSTARNGKVQLQIMCQPEQQHRARYQTEGSRGAVKDRTGNGFPIVKLIGYDKPTTLQVFIGTDLGRVAPHMFYQACRVSGKNSTPCVEKKIDGTIVIEVELEPSKDMIATCDCVGILKERNVDVEHRFPEQLSPRSKKKSTKCRMVFRTVITNDDGSTETLQVCSQPIVCTQPPGIPEICKKSLTSCPASGGLELFILGKNFLKDTKVVFQQQSAYDSSERSEVVWEETVIPDKEYLQQTHLVCVVPPFLRQDIQEPISIRLFIISSGKNSEAHTFMYTPTMAGSPSSIGASVAPVAPAAPIAAAAPAPVTVTGSAGKIRCVPTCKIVSKQSQFGDASKRNTDSGCYNEVHMEANPSGAPFLSKMLWQTGTPKQEMDLGMMPPPTSLVPLAQRRSSTNLSMESNSPPMRSLKTELMDENSQGSIVMENMMNENSLDMPHRFRPMSESSLDVHHDDANMTIINENSMDMIRQQEIFSENSNSVHSTFHCEKSNASIHNDESVDNSLTAEPRIFPQNSLIPPHNLIENTPLSTNDLKGIDLRMKSSLATINDLANSQTPSFATLHRFVVTESTNMPLPAQTGQSVENYLTTLENNISKSIVSNTLANSTMKSDNEQLISTTLLEGVPILSSQFSSNTPTGTNKLFSTDQVISNTLLTTSANHEILPSLTESHIKNDNSFQQHNIITSGPVMFGSQPTNNLLETSQAEVLKQENLIMSQQNLQAALNANILQNSTVAPKLDVLVETHIKSPAELSPIISTSPQEIQRSSLIVSQNSEILLNTSSPDVMLNSQVPLLVSTITPNEIIIRSPSNEPSIPPQISPSSLASDVILNPQISPSVMCRNSQDNLLQVNSICPSNVLSNTEILTTDTASNSSLLTLKNPPDSVERIVLNAAVDYLETQKKINEISRMDVRNNATTQEIISNNQAQVLLQNQAVSDLLKLSQTQFVANPNSQDILTQVNLNLTKQQENSKTDLNLVKQIAEQTVPSSQQPNVEMKKNEEGMMQALTNMSDNDLISYINPSCFDQGTFST